MWHMPALSTQQFDWARNRLPQRPQRVPPFFQPEVAARAIVEAVRKAPRELWVGGSTLKAIIGNMIAPGWLDTLLARRAIGGQVSEEPAERGHADNLFSPVPGRYGAHGRFERADRESKRPNSSH